MIARVLLVLLLWYFYIWYGSTLLPLDYGGPTHLCDGVMPGECVHHPGSTG